MDHLVPATVAEDSLDFTAFMPGDGAGIGRRIGRKTACDLAAVAVPYHHRVAAIEIALDRCDTGGEEARAALQGRSRAGIDDEHAHRVEAPGGPALPPRGGRRRRG